MAPVSRVSWTGGGNTVGVSSQDRTARFFDAATGKLRGLLLAEDEQLIAVGFAGAVAIGIAAVAGGHGVEDFGDERVGVVDEGLGGLRGEDQRK